MKKLVYIILIGMIISGCGSRPEEQVKNESKQQAAREAEMERLIKLGTSYIKEGDVLNAVQTFDEVIRVNPKDVRGYLILGETYMRLKSYDRAADTFTAALAQDPGNGKINYLLAVAHGLASNPQEAMVHAQRSVEIFQDEQDQDNFLKSMTLLQSLSAQIKK